MGAARAEPLAGNDGRDARRIDDEESRRDAPGELVERQVIDLVAHHSPHRLLRRHCRLGQMFRRELRPLQLADATSSIKGVHLGAEIAQAQAA